jgi:DNA-binding beta-propeller fold protein YncE
MTVHQPIQASSSKTRTPRLFFLELNAGKIHSVSTDGSDKRTIVTDARNPDGIAIDAEAGHIYWTNMGVPSANDGSIERANLDGTNRVMIIPPGATHTPKQITLDQAVGKLYWSDREGMRVMRSNLDGSHIETLIETGHGDADRREQWRWCVGIAVDREAGKFYWTQKGGDNAGVGQILCANIETPRGESPASRSDVELLFDQLPEPIDLEFDADNRLLYWTDRGDAPAGNTVNCAAVDEADAAPQILVRSLMEGIGIALNMPGNRMFFSDFGGSIYVADLDGRNARTLLGAQGNLTGIAYAEI